MADEQYKYDENGFREDLKGRDDVLHQPDADRSSWDTQELDYDQTVAVLTGKETVKPEMQFNDEVLEKVRQEMPKIDDTAVDKVIEDKYQQILLARYNVDQEENVTIQDDDQQK
ncbi:hypothetical protein [Limosilactobacillus sp.]|uniref:hypothetical protein n=1 Tax=Limosilactobacillus sp. TaxID=2773925 RepID=UPI003F07027B